MTQIPSQKRALFVFRRDLRIVDNTGLNAALKSGLPVITLFVLDPRQFDDHPYRSLPGREFLIESLSALDEAIQAEGGKLLILPGVAEELIPAIMKELSCTSLYLNNDYTPFSRARDERLKENLTERSYECFAFDDALLNAPDQVLKDNGTPYTVFTPYYKRAMKLPLKKVAPRERGTFAAIDHPKNISSATLNRDTRYDHPERPNGGRSAALGILESLSVLNNYDTERDIPALARTSRLSAHHKFGTISIRESAARANALFGEYCTFIKELFWRDFFTQIAFHFPHVFERSFNAAYDQVEWIDNPKHFEAWCTGMTGFPIVDAGMRELNATGLMHNRVRMITASFLTKDLHIHWRDGERYFARRLVDYDPAVNNGSWQWAASTGCDAQPYFRIFNPWLQQQKFDRECLYIKKWIPELEALSPKEIHALESVRPMFARNYPAPIVVHSHEKRLTEELFRKALS